MKRSVFLLIIIASLIGCENKPGPAGTPGKDGQPGADGKPYILRLERAEFSPDMCASEAGLIVRGGIDRDRSGALEDAEVEATNFVCDGTAGADGAPAPVQQYSVTSAIDPCGQQGSATKPDEIFLKLSNGMLVGSFSATAAGANTRISNIVPPQGGSLSGTTTDETNCGITVARSVSNQVTFTTSNGVGSSTWLATF